MKVATDLHIHSCLSPCGDDAMSPADLVGMSLLNGLELIALTDHNSARNCPAAASAAALYGIGFIPGVEVTTSEDIHAVCLFPALDSALEFDRLLYRSLPDIPNNPGIFGEQTIFSADGEPCGTESRLLITGCGISIIDLPVIIREFGGVCYPAHIDREGNGLLSVLGAWPEELDVKAAEFAGAPGAELLSALPDGLKIIRASDAHRLQDLPLSGFVIDMDSPDFRGLLKWLG